MIFITNYYNNLLQKFLLEDYLKKKMYKFVSSARLIVKDIHIIDSTQFEILITNFEYSSE